MYKRRMCVVCAAVVLLCGGCETLNSLMQYEKPTATLAGVSFGDVSLKEAELLFDVEIKNPYALALPLLNLDYTLQTGTAPLLNGKADLATAIPAKSSATVTLPVSFNYKDLLSAMKSLRGVGPGSQIPYTAQVGLSLDSPVIGVTRLPLTKEGMLQVPTVEDLAGTDWRQLLQDGKYLEILK